MSVNKNKCLVPAHKKRTEETHQKHIEQYGGKPVKTLLLGDSMMERLSTTAKDFFPVDDPSICIAGVGGDGIQHLLWRIERGLIKQIPAEKIILMIGTNNVENDSAQNIVDGIVNVVEKIHNDNSQAHIVVLGILQRNPPINHHKTKRIIDTLKSVNESLPQRLAGLSYCEFIDFSKEHTFDESHFEDHVHLNCEGYRIWFTMQLQKLII